MPFNLRKEQVSEKCIQRRRHRKDAKAKEKFWKRDLTTKLKMGTYGAAISYCTVIKVDKYDTSKQAPIKKKEGKS